MRHNRTSWTLGADVRAVEKGLVQQNLVVRPQGRALGIRITAGEANANVESRIEAQSASHNYVRASLDPSRPRYASNCVAAFQRLQRTYHPGRVQPMSPNPKTVVIEPPTLHSRDNTCSQPKPLVGLEGVL